MRVALATRVSVPRRVDHVDAEPGIIRTIYGQPCAEKFDDMLSNPPFGVDWKKVEGEHAPEGFDGGYSPGLPRVSDGSLLFLMYLISRIRDYDPNDLNKNGGRIGSIFHRSSLVYRRSRQR